MSLRALARKLYRAHSSLVEYERGHRLAPLEVVEAYQTELGVTSGALVALHERIRLELYGADRSHRQTYVLKPAQEAPHQLPPDVPNFTGREAELTRLRAIVAGSAAETVVTLVIAGAAGVGKTALAVHLAHALAPAYPDTQLHVNLHGYEPAQRLSPAQALDRFLRALGVPADALTPGVEEQAARYRGLLAGRRCLVVLDDASSAEQVRPLMPASPNCLVLITSRDRLAGMVAAEGAQLLILDVLAPEEAGELLARTAGPGRVHAEPQAAAEVARLCGHLPLAVRIAAARLAIRPAMRLATLAERLRDERGRLGELAAGDVEVRASFASSYRALDLPTAQAFRRIGLIPGPDFARGVAAALTATTPEKAEAVLETLVDAHLVEMSPVPGRYRLHDLLRLYARERAHAEETDEARQGAVLRMLDWYLDTADAAERLLVPGRKRLPYERTDRHLEPTPASLEQALAWFEVERASLLSAIQVAARGGSHALVWQLSDAMWGFFSLRSYWSDWRTTHELSLAAARTAGNRHAEAWMMISLAHMYSELHQFDVAVELRQQSLAIFRELGDPEGEARALTGLGSNYLDLRRLGEAIECLQTALAIARRTGYLYREGVALENLGEAYRGLRRFEDATACYQRALAIRRQLGGRRGEATTLRNLGEVYGDLRRLEDAIDCFRESLAISKQIGYRWGEGRCLDLLGLVLQRTEDMRQAQACWHEALAIFTDLGAPQADDVRAHLAVAHGAASNHHQAFVRHPAPDHPS